jgi:hypothetical protein
VHAEWPRGRAHECLGDADLSEKALDFGSQPIRSLRKSNASAEHGVGKLAGLGRGIGDMNNACRNLACPLGSGVGAAGNFLAYGVMLLHRHGNRIACFSTMFASRTRRVSWRHSAGKDFRLVIVELTARINCFRGWSPPVTAD